MAAATLFQFSGELSALSCVEGLLCRPLRRAPGRAGCPGSQEPRTARCSRRRSPGRPPRRPARGSVPPLTSSWIFVERSWSFTRRSMSSCVKPVSSRNSWYSFSVLKFSSLVRANSCSTSRSEASMPRSSASPKIQAVSRTSFMRLVAKRGVLRVVLGRDLRQALALRGLAAASASKRSRLIWPSSTMPSTLTPSTTATESSFGLLAAEAGGRGDQRHDDDEQRAEHAGDHSLFPPVLTSCRRITIRR